MRTFFELPDLLVALIITAFGAVMAADVVLSNSFHATAFSLILHKEFFVLERQEKLNARLRDLLDDVGLGDRLVNSFHDIQNARKINWVNVDKRLQKIIDQSRVYLKEKI